MKVICINHNGEVLQEGVYAYTTNSQFRISVGSEYTGLWDCHFKRFRWYFVCEDHFDGVYI